RKYHIFSHIKCVSLCTIYICISFCTSTKTKNDFFQAYFPFGCNRKGIDIEYIIVIYIHFLFFIV
ncbi:hypothetical protein BDB01DRAFT_803851, partial [Pilobolus umbonatus]